MSNKVLIDKKFWLTKSFDWQKVLTDKKFWLTKSFDWQKVLIDKTFDWQNVWLTKRLIDKTFDWQFFSLRLLPVLVGLIFFPLQAVLLWHLYNAFNNSSVIKLSQRSLVNHDRHGLYFSVCTCNESKVPLHSFAECTTRKSTSLERLIGLLAYVVGKLWQKIQYWLIKLHNESLR